MKEVYYIVEWDEYGNIQQTPYKDCVFTSKDKSEQYCKKLNNNDKGLEYEVYSAFVDRL